MNKKDLFLLQSGLADVGKLQGVKFAYAVARNLQIIKREMEALQEAIKPSDDFSDFEKKRLELCRKHADKNEKGDPIIIGSEFSIQDRQSFDIDLENLRDNHHDVCELRERQVEEYEQLLEETCDLDLHKIAKDNLPENITAEQIFGIIDIIENDNSERNLKAVKSGI